MKIIYGEMGWRVGFGVQWIACISCNATEATCGMLLQPLQLLPQRTPAVSDWVKLNVEQPKCATRQSHWPHSLRRGSAAAQCLGFESRRGHGYLSFVSVVLPGRGLCDGLISRPKESYRVWCVWVCVIVKPRQWGGPGPLGLSSHGAGGGGGREVWRTYNMYFSICRCFSKCYGSWMELVATQRIHVDCRWILLSSC
jgi:hypothetical protein